MSSHNRIAIPPPRGVRPLDRATSDNSFCRSGCQSRIPRVARYFASPSGFFRSVSPNGRGGPYFGPRPRPRHKDVQEWAAVSSGGDSCETEPGSPLPVFGNCKDKRCAWQQGKRKKRVEKKKRNQYFRHRSGPFHGLPKSPRFHGPWGRGQGKATSVNAGFRFQAWAATARNGCGTRRTFIRPPAQAGICGAQGGARPMGGLENRRESGSMSTHDVGSRKKMDEPPRHDTVGSTSTGDSQKKGARIAEKVEGVQGGTHRIVIRGARRGGSAQCFRSGGRGPVLWAGVGSAGGAFFSFITGQSHRVCFSNHPKHISFLWPLSAATELKDVHRMDLRSILRLQLPNRALRSMPARTTLCPPGHGASFW